MKLNKPGKKPGGVGDRKTYPKKQVKQAVERLKKRGGEQRRGVDRTYYFCLSRGWTKRRLIAELALMEKTQAQLAREYGVTDAAITAFKKRNAADIEAKKRDIENEFVGLWIAQKGDRLAEYQQDVEDIINMAAEHGHSVDWIRVKHNALKSVAEEMGHLPTKHNVQVEAKNVSYVIEGVNPDDV